MSWTKQLTWVRHTGSQCPVTEHTKVVYRTAYEDDKGLQISHIHLPVTAGVINWKPVKGFGQIYEYAVVG